jgi:4-amino-4-deoxy-L-arabinose transferase-like glycosyltransferase
MSTHYTLFQIISIFGTAAIGVAAIVYWHILKKYKTAFFLLIAATVFIRISIIQYDPYLNYWDEQYHALVAKNMMQEPLKPMLYTDPALPYNPAVWIHNHVWLHKPPLFLWKMALSMKIFGVNEIAARLPSAIMSVLTVLMIFSLAKKWTNKHIAFYSTLLAAFSSYGLDLVSGYHHTEHNDVAFIFYATASLWAWTQYDSKRNIKWSILVGIAAGCAVLVKWLPGLIIFAAWGMSIIVLKINRKSFVSYAHIAISTVTCAIVFVPWQLYIAHQFPQEFAITSLAKAKHLWEVVEDHGGGLFYHFHIMDFIYAKNVQWIFIPAFLLFLKRLKKRETKVLVFVFWFIPFLVYSLAATKMPSFTLMTSAIVFLSLGTLIYEAFLFAKPRYQKNAKLALYISVGVLIGSMFWMYNVDSIQKYHTYWKKDYAIHRSMRTSSAQVFRKMNEEPIPSNAIILNLKHNDAIMCMFYTPYTAYEGIPDDWRMALLIETQRPLYVMHEEGNDEFKKNYPQVMVLHYDYH